MSDPSVTVRFSELRQGAASHEHAHWHVLWGFEHTIEVELEGGSLRLGAGRALVVAPHQRHALAGPRGARCFVVDSHDEAHIARLAPLAGQLRTADASVAHLLRYLAGRPALPAAAADLLMDGLYSGSLPESIGQRRRIDWSALEAWIDAHVAQPLSVAMLAARVHLSPTQFAARCREEAGLSPMALVRRQRLAAALRLRGAGVSVASAARQCGYHSPSALTAALRRDAQAA